MKQKAKKTIRAAACLALLLCCLARPLCAVYAAETPPPDGQEPTVESEATPPETPAVLPENIGGLYVPGYIPAAAAVCLVNEDSGQVVYEQNADAPVVAASLVKLMTAMLVMDNVADLDGTRIASDKSWIYDELYGKNASHADIRLGETLSARELLYAMLLPSGNEAALLLADHVSGGYMKNFLYLMNNRAEALGCTGTTFVDPNGLSEENITTARDMCILMQAFMQYPALVEIAAAPIYEMAAHEGHSAPYNILNTNKLVTPTSPYYTIYKDTAGLVTAGKTGSLGEWQNFVSQATNGAETYTLAVMGSPNGADTFGAALEPAQARPALYETAVLYNWVFTGYSIRPALDPTQPISEIPVRYSTQADAVMLLPEDDLKAILPVDAEDSQIEKSFDVPEFLAAPVEEGQLVGTVTLTLSGQVIGTSNLRTAGAASRNSTLFAVRKTQEFFGSLYFKVVVILVIAAVCLYVGAVTILVYLQQKKKK